MMSRAERRGDIPSFQFLMNTDQSIIAYANKGMFKTENWPQFTIRICGVAFFQL